MNQRSQPFRVKIFRSCRRILLACLAVYAVFCLGCATFQRSLIYYPTTFTPVQVKFMAQSAKLERWCNAAGDPIGMKRLAPVSPGQGQVLVTYGNGSSAVGCSHYADDIQKLANWDVFILEYPGYADRPGRPTQKTIFSAATEALQLLDSNRPVYLVGESLGTGVAAYLAGTYSNRIAGVVLIAPFTRLADAAAIHYSWLPVHWLLVDRFPSEVFLRQYHGPVGIIVGGCDRVVPEELGRRLYAGYQGPKQLWTFPKDGHGDLFGRLPSVWSQLSALWQSNQVLRSY